MLYRGGRDCKTEAGDFPVGASIRRGEDLDVLAHGQAGWQEGKKKGSAASSRERKHEDMQARAALELALDEVEGAWAAGVGHGPLFSAD